MPSSLSQGFSRFLWLHGGSTHPILKRTIGFAAIQLLLGIGIGSGFFSANALLVSKAGTQPLFYIYFGSSIFSLLLGGIFYLLADRLPRRLLFRISFLLLGLVIFVCWAVLQYHPGMIGLYFFLRIFLFGVLTLSNLEFWILASEAFTNLEAKRRFPQLIAAQVLGIMLGGFLASEWAVAWGTLNLMLIWAGVLWVAPFLLPSEGRIFKAARLDKPAARPAPIPTRLGPQPKILIYALFLFWLAYAFFAYGVDFEFNTIALKAIPDTNRLASFYGSVVLVSSSIVFFFQLFLAAPLSLRFGVEREVLFFSLLVFLSIVLLSFFEGLWVAALVEGFIFIFADFAVGALVQPTLNLFPQGIRGRVKVLTEGFGRPAGLLLLLVVGLASSALESTLSFWLLGTAGLFLIFPFFFRKAYRSHLRGCLSQADPLLLTNAVQALGEPAMKPAVPALLRLLKNARGVDLKKTIVLSLGRIQSREALRDIVDLFAVKDESLQLAVLESLGSYRNYEGMLALFRLLHSGHTVSTQVRMSATFVLTRLIGKKMILFLLEELDDPDPRVRANAIESVGLLKDKETMAVLLPFLQDSNNRIRANTAVALHGFLKTRKRALKTIQELLASSSLESLLSGIYAAGETRHKSFAKELAAGLKSTEPRLVEHAAAALAKIQNPEFLKPMLSLLTHPEAAVGIRAARHIGRFPRASRLLLFEAISELPRARQEEILLRLDQTLLDFTLEKTLLEEQARREADPELQGTILQWAPSGG